MEKQQFISRGEGELVRRESFDWSLEVVVVSGDGWNEWAVISDGMIVAESEAIYGDVSSALRDGLVYATTEKFVKQRDSDLEYEVVNWPEAVTVYPPGDRPRLREFAA